MISVLSKLEEYNVEAIENFWSEWRKHLLVSIELRANKWPITWGGVHQCSNLISGCNFVTGVETQILEKPIGELKKTSLTHD